MSDCRQCLWNRWVLFSCLVLVSSCTWGSSVDDIRGLLAGICSECTSLELATIGWMVLWRSWRQACLLDGDGRQETIQNQSRVMWVLPLVGRLKLNTDASLQSGVKVFRMRAVIRDHAGVVLVIRECWDFYQLRMMKLRLDGIGWTLRRKTISMWRSWKKIHCVLFKASSLIFCLAPNEVILSDIIALTV